MIILSGGAGVEHLAQAFQVAGKPVIPFDLDLGSSSNDGNRGAARLARKMVADPSQFFKCQDQGRVGSILRNMSTQQGQAPIRKVVNATIELLQEIVSPSVFYIRLLNKEHDDYLRVENFFRDVVDIVAHKLDYSIVEMGRTKNDYFFMHQEIFEKINKSSLVIADITSLRPNCFTEIGFALRSGKPVILMAHEDTQLPFDLNPIECFFWDDLDDKKKLINDLENHLERNRFRKFAYL